MNGSQADSRVVVFAPFGKDAVLVERVLAQSAITVRVVHNAKELEFAIPEYAEAAVITEEVLQNGTINALAQKLCTQPPWSDFPVLVLTGGGLSTESTESLDRSRAPLGNVTLLERPLRPVTLTSAVRSALLARRRQYQVRDYLQQRKVAEDALRRAHDALEVLVEQRTEALRNLSAELLRVQDEERRRIARELHDSLGQDLTAAKICLDMLAASGSDRAGQLYEVRKLVERSIADTRTLSHLLHPPLLDEAGLFSAVSWYVEGFGKRSGIKTKLFVPEPLQRLPRPTETALFRIMQEALTNVHRHSASKAVEVSLTIKGPHAELEVRDFGKGIPRDVLDLFHEKGASGVGLAGIRERLTELGGVLEIESSPKGTMLKARVPVSDKDQTGQLQTDDLRRRSSVLLAPVE